jgi:hypothetical protein
MLAAKKEEFRLRPVVTNHSLGGFGKVLNSIQGLEQRLGEFSVDELSKANEGTQTLILRLSDLQNKLNSLTKILATVNTAQAAFNATANEAPDLSKLLAADKNLHIQSVLNARNLIRFPRLHKAAKDPVKGPSLALVVKEPETPMPASDLHVSVTSEPVAKIAEPQLSISSVAQESPSFLAPQDVPPPSPPTPPTTPLENESPVGSPHTALVPANANIDQKLLSELIENYGEFATTPNLPATVEPVAKPKAKFNDLKMPSGHQARDSELAKNRVPGLKKDGDLDRKLKKLIKDYGEYDLYPRPNNSYLRRGVIAAFVLLGVLFSGFYFFASSKSVKSPHAATARESGVNAIGDATKPATGSEASDKAAPSSRARDQRSPLKPSNQAN